MSSQVQPPHQASDRKVDTRTSGEGLGEISGDETDGQHPDGLVAKAVDAANEVVAKDGEDGQRSKASLVDGWRYLNKDGKSSRNKGALQLSHWREPLPSVLQVSRANR